MEPAYGSIFNKIDEYREEIVNFLKEIIRIPAICPDYGGKGELRKAERVKQLVKSWGFDEVIEVNSVDERAEGGIRPNIAFLHGKGESRVWFISHLDVVQPGEISSWTISNPFEPVLRDNKLYGRGSEDNGQGIVSTLFSAKALIETEANLKRPIGVLLVSDEECGSKYGLQHVLNSSPDLIRKNDLVVVPDAGSPDGLFIEIAEKSILWLKFSIEGKQTHASTPNKGFNAHRVGVQLASNLDRILKNKYFSQNSLFDPPESTFELTMASSSSNSPNIIPGRYEFVLDSRVLPVYPLDEVLQLINNVVSYIEKINEEIIDGERFPKIKVDILQRFDAPPPTPADSEIVKLLRESIKIVKGKEPRIGGVGGGTVASFLRKRGIPAAVWSTIDETAHQPNEYAVIDNILSDAKVFSLLPLL
ncbi:MAG: M20 family metallo-hydrolase [Fervidicoccaceae archaeon]